jgi:Arm DNA-binding domain
MEKTMARLLLNAKVVNELQAKKKRVEYFDTKEPGFCLRVSPEGTKSFGVYYRFNGRLRCYTIGRTDQITLSDAIDQAREVKRTAHKGETDPAAERKEERRAETFSELAEQYIERYAQKSKSTWKDDRRIVIYTSLVLD